MIARTDAVARNVSFAEIICSYNNNAKSLNFSVWLPSRCTRSLWSRILFRFRLSFYARELSIARISHSNSVLVSVCHNPVSIGA